MFIPRDSVLFKQNFTIFTNLLLDLISLVFYVLFCFERKEIKKESKTTHLPLFLIEVDNGVLTKQTLGGQSAKFWTTGRQSEKQV